MREAVAPTPRPIHDGPLDSTRARFALLWRRTRDSYWFVPAVLSVVFGGLAVAVQAWDRAGLVPGWASSWPVARDGRAVVSMLATVMLTTAGVTFSITMAAVANATTLYGPRILTLFLSDRSNQLTLGALVAAFVYGLVVLVQQPGAGSAPAFWTGVTTLGVGLGAVGLLIFFLNHVPGTLHASFLVERLGRSLLAGLERPFPWVGEAGPSSGSVALPHAVRASATGYVSRVEVEALFGWACAHETVVALAVRPGDFVIEGQVVLWVGGDEAHPVLAGGVVVTAERTASQDLMFMVDELAEVATRALSPGVNDPYTAMNTMDWMAAVLVKATRCPANAGWRYDARGALRLVSPPVGFEQLVRRYVEQVRPYAVADRNALLRLVLTIGRVAEVGTPDAAARALLRSQLEAVASMGRSAVPAADRSKLTSRVQSVRALLAG